MTNSRIIRIFLASSITELKDERDKLSEYFAGADIQNMFLADNVIIQLVRCEDIYAGSDGEQAQELLNQRLRECDISLFLFKTKAGKRTIEELHVAKAIQTENRKHTILVYCMNVPPDKRNRDLKSIIKKLDEEGPDWYRVESAGDVKAAFIRSIIKYERELLIRLGERYEPSAESMQFNTALEKTEKAGEENLKKYEFHRKHQVQAQKDIHHDIDTLLSQVKEIMADPSEPVASRIYRTMEVYHKLDLWISKSDYDREKYNTLLSDYASFLYDCGMYYDAEKVYLRQIALAEELYGREHENTATSYNDIGLVYWKQGIYPKALEYHKKALEIREKVLGTDHPDTATTYNNIGLVYKRQGNYPKALEYIRKALEIRVKVLGINHRDTAGTYNNIGTLYYKHDNYLKALEYYQMALEIKEKVLGLDHPGTAISYNNIGKVYEKQGEYAKALEYHQKALEIRTNYLGIEHPAVAITYTNFGLVYQNQKDYPKALEYYQKALKIKEKVLGTEHPSTATTYYYIGSMFYELKKYTEALKYLEMALQIRKAILGDNHSDTIATQEWINKVKSALKMNM